MSASLTWGYKRVYVSVNYRLRTTAGGRFALHCRPSSIIILLTEICNAKCTDREDSASSETWKKVLTDIRRWLGPVQVTFSGGLFQEILTHGYWEDQNKMVRLANTNPWRITVSLDGVGETHTIVRGHPLFWERISRSLDTLLRMQEGKASGLPITSG